MQALKRSIRDERSRDEAQAKEKEEILRKLGYLESKALRGNMTSKNIIRLYDIIGAIDDETTTDEEIIQSINALYSNVR